MAFMEGMFGKSDDVDIEEFLNNLEVHEQDMYENADAYIKPFSLEKPEDTATVIDEVRKGNIVLLNIENLSKRNAIKLRELISYIRDAVDQIDGDIARISQDRVIVTPARVKIVKRH